MTFLGPKVKKPKGTLLIYAHGGRWGPGKAHRAQGTRPSDGTYPVCQPTKPVHGELRRGRIEDVTCKNCIGVATGQRRPSR